MRPWQSVCDHVSLSVCRRRTSPSSAPEAGSSCPGIGRQKEVPTQPSRAPGHQRGRGHIPAQPERPRETQGTPKYMESRP